MINATSSGSFSNMEINSPQGSGPFPAVLVLFGTRGMNEPFGTLIRDFATALVDAGYLTAIPFYLESTGTAASNSVDGDIAMTSVSFPKYGGDWLDALGQSLGTLQARTDVDGTRVALLGFSMGAYLSLRTAIAAGSPLPKAVIDFFGPVSMLGGLDGGIKSLPAVQIHHGEADLAVPVQQSIEFASALKASGRVEGTDYEIYLYKGEGHGFKDPQSVADSKRRVLEFLQAKMP